MKQKDIQAMQINTDLLDLIAPIGINLKRNSIEIGENISKILYVSGYSSTANIGWLVNIINIYACTVNITVEPIDAQSFIEGISKGLNTDRTTYNTTRNEVEKTRAERKIKDAEEIIRDVESNSTAYVYVSFVVKVNGKDEKELEKNVKTFKNRIVGMGLKVRVPSFLMEEAYRQASPFATCEDSITKISNKNMSLLTLMGGLPFSRLWFCGFYRLFFRY